MEKKYYLREKGKNIAYTFDELLNKNLKRNTKVWIEGSFKWQRLDRIPGLAIIYNKIPPKRNSNFWIYFIVIFLIGGISYLSWYYYEKNKKPILTEMNSEQLYNEYASSVVLIKHSFLYKIKIGDNVYYFKHFDPETGEIDELKDLSELKNEPNVIWGTGFFVNDNGNVLTNRHIVQVNPTEEEQNKILNYLKEDSYQKVSQLEEIEYQLNDKIYDLNYTINNISLTEYEFTELDNELNLAKEKLRKAEFLKILYLAILELNSLPTNFVSKTSTEFGIFFNKEKTNDYKNYIKYKSLNISNDKNVDLAILEPVNKEDFKLRKLKKVDLSLLDSLNFKPRKINDKVRMIGFNHGNKIAETTNGINSQLTEGNISQINDDFKMLYTIPALPGSSGSPIFDKYGRLLSVNFAGFLNTQNFNYGIQTKKLQEYLIKNNIIKKNLN